MKSGPVDVKAFEAWRKLDLQEALKNLAMAARYVERLRNHPAAHREAAQAIVEMRREIVEIIERHKASE